MFSIENIILPFNAESLLLAFFFHPQVIKCSGCPRNQFYCSLFSVKPPIYILYLGYIPNYVNMREH